MIQRTPFLIIISELQNVQYCNEINKKTVSINRIVYAFYLRVLLFSLKNINFNGIIIIAKYPN